MRSRYRFLIFVAVIGAVSCAPPGKFNRTTSSSPTRTAVFRESSSRLQKLERTNRDMSKRALIYQIRYYLGVPYEYGGADRRGMDCSGFVWKVYWEGMNVELPRSASQMYANCKRLGVKEVRLGDLLFFQSDSDRAVDHVGIFLYKTFFAHASTNYGVMISDLKEPYFRSRFIGAGRFGVASIKPGDEKF